MERLNEQARSHEERASVKGYEWVEAVLSRSRAELGARLLLVALAARANAAGECWPSLADLAARTTLTRRGVRFALRRLERLGELETAPGRGRGHTNRYRLGPCFWPGEKGKAVPLSRPRKGEILDTKRGNPRHEKGKQFPPEPNKNLPRTDARARATQVEGRARAQTPDPDPTATRPLDLFHEALARLAQRTGRAPPAALGPPPPAPHPVDAKA
jgi:Helix-turn-helix domain